MPARVEQVEADVAEAERAVRLEEVAGDADAEHGKTPRSRRHP